MTVPLITPENATNELLRSVLEDALMECRIEDDVLVARDVFRCGIFPSPEGGFITLRTPWGFKDGTPHRERLDLANRINDRLPVVKTFVTARGALAFEYDLVLDGGITRRGFATAVRRYLHLMREAIHEFGDLIQ